MRLGLRPLVLAALLLPSLLRAAGEQSFCTFQRVEVETVRNAVRLKLIADGMQQIEPEWEEWWAPEDDGNWNLATRDHIRFNLRNVRSGVASIVQVGQYPVSHLEFSVPPGSRENVGLVCTLVLYKAAAVTSFKNPDDEWNYSSWWGTWPQVMITSNAGQDQIVITVLNDVAEEPEPERPTIDNPRTHLEVSSSASGVELRALNMDLHTVLDEISLTTGVGIVVDDEVQHRVTANFEGLPLPQLLRALCAGYGLCIAEGENGYHVTHGVPETAATVWTTVSRNVKLQYLPAGQALLLLPRVMLHYVKVNAEANSLVLTGPPLLLDRLERDLAVLDQPGYQCRLRAWLVSTENENQDLRSIIARLTGGDTSVVGGSEGHLQIDTGITQARDTLVQLRRLAQRKQLRMAALPSILCKSGQRGRLFVGEQIYYWQLSNDYYQDLQLTSVAAGSRLDITPRTAGEWIIARVNVENSFLAQDNDLGPLLYKRSANAAVRMDSGSMLVIGSLRSSTSDHERARTLAGTWPIDAILSGRLKYRQSGEVYVLVEAEALLTPSPYQGKTPAVNGS